jgi:1,4-alpha-glucan branching enzyme
VSLVLEGVCPNQGIPLKCEPGGYFSVFLRQARPGTRYRFRLDEDATLYPDLA